MKSLEPVGIRRLRKLQKYMAKMTDALHFDMDRWLAHDGTSGIDTIHGKGVDQLTNLEDCGTVACALGHACILFHKEGLRFGKEGRFVGVPTFKVAGDTAWGYGAAALFFGISYDDSERLFMSTGLRKSWTPQMWAGHCRDWLDQHYPKKPSLLSRLFS